VIGGGPKFRKFGRRVMYAVADLDAWADQRSFEATSDPNTPSTTRPTAVRADRRRAGGHRHVQPIAAACGSHRRSANSSTCSARCRATWRRATART
jgi:hypothetical protein